MHRGTDPEWKKPDKEVLRIKAQKATPLHAIKLVANHIMHRNADCLKTYKRRSIIRYAFNYLGRSFPMRVCVYVCVQYFVSLNCRFPVRVTEAAILP